MRVLALLPLPGEGVALRRAVADDVPAIVDLLADDELAADRNGISTEDDLAAYLAGFTRSTLIRHIYCSWRPRVRNSWPRCS